MLIELGVLGVVLLIVGNMVLPWIPVVLVLMLIQVAFVLGIALILCRWSTSTSATCST